MIKAFLSHKSKDSAEAEALAQALSVVLANDEIFRYEEIDKSDDYHDSISQALGQAKCFILLYTDPALDWSWCFYEAGRFAGSETALKRRIFCLHPMNVQPPGPIANLQTIPARPRDIEAWIRNDLCSLFERRQPSGEDLDPKITKIEKIVNSKSPVQERNLKPYIWVSPIWPVGRSPEWNAEDLPEISFSAASISVDKDSAIQLGFGNPPNSLELLQFLRRLDSGSDSYSGWNARWIEKFYDSLREAIRENLLFQEAAFFRHESGRVLRPIVVSVAKNSIGTICRLRVMFTSAFGPPLTDDPSAVQRLADGIRLAVRTRLEVVDPYLGQMSRIHHQKVLSERPEDALAKQNPVGGRLIAALDAIWQEAVSHGVKPTGPAPRLFGESDQRDFEELRSRALSVVSELKFAAEKEDKNGAGEYAESERLLGELDKINRRYLRVALPRLEELLAPADG
jgi:TIR domain